MESGDKLICFGDSITNLYATELKQKLQAKAYELDLSYINAGIGGETTRDGLARLPGLLNEGPDYVVVSFGMNDRLQDLDKNVPLAEFRDNLKKIVESFVSINARVILLTINPVRSQRSNEQIDLYNQAIYDVWRDTKVRLVDVNSHWRTKFRDVSRGLRDDVHPNKDGINLICEYVLRMLSRHSYIILWMYNGNPCACNYKCPYCRYDSQKGHHFHGTVEEWRLAFKQNFGDQHLVFYLAHGEPMLGKKFYEVLEMIGGEPKWEGRMTTNLSLPLNKLVQTRVFREGRFNINASFHPHMTTKENFLEKLLFLRDNGIESPVVYVMYPPLFNRFKEDFDFFNRYDFLVHVRRFRGPYNGKNYPEAYTDDELRFIARFCDDQTIKSMLFDEPSYERLTWSGIDFFAVDNKGNVGYCDDYRPEVWSMGNLYDNNFNLIAEPQPFPAKDSSDGTVDGVANFVDINYSQLSGNNVIDFARQGGVYHMENSIYYKNTTTDFKDPKIRAEYHFPCRNVFDALEVLKNPEDSFKMKINRLKYSVNRNIFNYSTNYSLIRYLIQGRRF